MVRAPRLVFYIPVLIFAAGSLVFAQAVRDQAWHGTPIDTDVMTAQRTHYVAPVYPDLARANHTEGNVVLHANIDTEGKVVGLQTVSGNPLLIRAALEAASQWRYKPTIINGQAVNVDTTITIVFALNDQRSVATPAAPQFASGVVLHLESGRTIRADTAHEVGDKVEYTIGEGTYRIKKSSVKDITMGTDSAESTGAAPESSGKQNVFPNEISDKVTASPLNALPRNPAEDPANWSLYESTEQLRAECQKGEISKRVHPEFQSTSSFPISKDEAARECFALNLVMDPDYERLIDRGTALEKKLCTANNLKPLYNLRPDLKLTPDYEELARVTTEFHKRLEAEMKNLPANRSSGLRLLMDSLRLSGSCGHGMG